MTTETTDELIGRVKPDVRGRLAFSKILETINGLLSAHVSGFDVTLNRSNGSLTFWPTVEVPAHQAVVLSPIDWRAFNEVLNRPEEPNEALKKAARRHRAAVRAGTMKPAMATSEGSTRKATQAGRVPEQAENTEHQRVPEHVEHRNVRTKLGKMRTKVKV